MGLPKTNLITLFILVALLHLAAIAAASEPIPSFNITGFNEKTDATPFAFVGADPSYPSIDDKALQLTRDTYDKNDRHDYTVFHNKSGRAMYNKSFKLWHDNLNDDAILASFNSTFVINLWHDNLNWKAGHGLAFLIAPNVSIPEASYGQWMGLSNGTTDGNSANQIVAIEFDTKQDGAFDPDDNHVGLNINSIRSKKTIPLSNFSIQLSPPNETNYSVWVQYDGKSKVMEVYMVKEGDPKPDTPLLKETINLKDHVNQESYFGFSASTGDPEIQFNCVLKWSLAVENFPKKKDWMWLKVSAPAVLVLILFVVGIGVVYMKKKRRTSVEESDMLGTLKRLPGMPREFRYKNLKKATSNFHDSMRLGQGGFGIVYKGVLHDDDDRITEIAVKKFSRDNIKGKDDFLAELTIIHRLRHKHLVRLVGWCYESGKLLLVYDFMPNGSLEKHLYEASNNQNVLNWEHRYKILTGVASALHYLHNEYDQKVVHRDLKASNIMLDSDFNARLGDFGLARALDNGRTSYAELVLGGVPGTFGYVAPECFHTGKATPESDVFGFGAVVLEVICGKSPGSKIHHQQHLYTLVDWVWTLHREGRILEAVDEMLREDYVVDEAKRLLLLGLACSHPIASERPQTQAILQIISGTVSAPPVPPFKPLFTWSSINTTTTTDSSLSTITVSS